LDLARKSQCTASNCPPPPPCAPTGGACVSGACALR
jgi:hypothetical protein